MKMSLSRSQIIKIEGPAYIQVLEGSLLVLGKRMIPREYTIVPKSKTMVFEALEDSQIELRLGESGKIERLEDATIPIEWKTAVEKILSIEKPVTIIVLGNVDSGKTTFCTFLVNQAFLKGYKTAIIDNDLGQSDVGPPTTVGLGFLERTVASLSEVPLFDAFFAGSTSPNGLIERVILGSRHLLDLALKNNANVIVVNTSGWVSGRGARALKLSLMLLLNPRVIVAIQRSGELEHLLKPFQGLDSVNIIRIPTPRVLRVRDREERKFLREASYSRYLVKAKVRVLFMDKIGIMFSFLGSGFPIPQDEIKQYEFLIGMPIVYGESSFDSILLIVKGSITLEHRLQLEETIRKETGKEEVIILPQGFERNLLAGLFSPQGVFLGLGLIREINFYKRTIEIFTPVEDEIGLMIIGHVKISEDGKEIKKLDPWTF